MKWYRIRVRASNGDWLYLDAGGSLHYGTQYASVFSTQALAMRTCVFFMQDWSRVTGWEMEVVEN